MQTTRSATNHQRQNHGNMTTIRQNECTTTTLTTLATCCTTLLVRTSVALGCFIDLRWVGLLEVAEAVAPQELLRLRAAVGLQRVGILGSLEAVVHQVLRLKVVLGCSVGLQRAGLLEVLDAEALQGLVRTNVALG